MRPENTLNNWVEYRPKEFEYNGKWIRNWFSNMVLSAFQVNGIVWPSVENYYQAMKTLDQNKWIDIAVLTPSAAKKEGRALKLRPDWEDVKYDIMKDALRHKFSKPEWRDKLLATNTEVIIEWNNWGDRIWGVDISNNRGQNLLGYALMDIRAEIFAACH
jgi:ribA/ribD-fused uncharacterized protein